MRMKNFDKKPFPWRCSKCGEQAVYGANVDYATTMHHDGHDYAVKVDGLKAARCVKCGQIKLDAEALEFLDGVFIRQLHLLTPEQVLENRLKAKVSQHDLAVALGVEDYVVEQLESGGYTQSRTLDNLMRLLFGLSQVREILSAPQIGTLPADAPSAPMPASGV